MEMFFFIIIYVYNAHYAVLGFKILLSTCTYAYKSTGNIQQVLSMVSSCKHFSVIALNCVSALIDLRIKIL